MMLAPLRDHLCPKDPKSSPLLCATKKHYFDRLSVMVGPSRPGFEEARWITSEDVNVEHLLDVFTSTDAESGDIWDTCAHFMEHLYWHKKRLVVLGPKIEKLRDDHPSKPRYLVKLSWLFNSVGNHMERKRLLSHALKLRREVGDVRQVARTLRFLSDANRLLGLYKEGIQQVREALEAFERLGDVVEQARCLSELGWLLYEDNQLDAAEEAVSRAIDLPGKSKHFLVCRCHRILGDIYRSRGKRDKAIHHLETALGIAYFLKRDDQLAQINYSLAVLFSSEGRFDDAHVHLERAKSHVVNDAYQLGLAVELQAKCWYQQRRYHEAKSEALHAIDLFEKLGAAKDVECTKKLLQRINEEMNNAQETERRP